MNLLNGSSGISVWAMWVSASTKAFIALFLVNVWESKIIVLHLGFALCALSLQADEVQDVLHFNYTSWPDHGVPTVNAIESILQFVQLVRQQVNRTKGPVIVHCRWVLRILFVFFSVSIYSCVHPSFPLYLSLSLSFSLSVCLSVSTFALVIHLPIQEKSLNIL